MRLKGGKVEAGVGIGEIRINMSREELMSRLVLYKDLSDYIIRIRNSEFYLDHKDRVYKIIVGDRFKGKFLGYIGIGSTLEDIQKYAGDVKEYNAEIQNMDVAYELKNYPGIRFELAGKGKQYYVRKKNASVKRIIVFRKEMEIIHGNVEPGIGIGDFKINMSKEELLDKIGLFYKNYSHNIIEVGNAKFWLDNHDRVEGIAVDKDFKGKFLEHIGMGSTLVDVLKYAREYFEDYDTYGLKDYKGIRFELGEQEYDDNWDEMTAPLGSFIVFREGNRIEGENIEPEVGIGEFKIDMSKEELLKKLGTVYTIQEDNSVSIGNATFWLDNDNKVYKISVEKVYGGKFLGHIGIGSTLTDIKKYVGDFYKKGATYELKDYPGISFGIGDEGYDYTCDEIQAPIKEIIVFRREVVNEKGI